MPPRNNFPIGIHHYIDYLNANVNQLNLYNIPHSRDPNSDDSDPGSPASSHGGDRTAQPALIPVNYGADIEQGSSFPSQYVTFSDPGPYLPAHSDHSATSVNSLIPSTSSYPRPTSASESSEHGYSVRNNPPLLLVLMLMLCSSRQAQPGLCAVIRARL
jgi:hypothetical protein